MTRARAFRFTRFLLSWLETNGRCHSEAFATEGEARAQYALVRTLPNIVTAILRDRTLPIDIGVVDSFTREEA